VAGRIYPLRLLIDLYRRFRDDDVPALGAQMTFYLILSFFPFLIFLLTLTAYTPLSREEVAVDIIAIVPASAQVLVQNLLNELIQEKNTTLLSLGMAAAIWTASSGMMAIIRTLNKAYEEMEHRAYWKIRLMAIGYTIGFTIAIIFSFVLLVFGKLLGQLAYRTLHLSADFELWWNPLKYGLSLLIMCVIFSLLYYSAPSRRMKFKEVIPGSIFATFGWIIVSLLFSFYVNRFGNYDTTYGSLGGIIVLLIWLYLSSIILLLGGELNASITYIRHGRKKT
jgi:membrane protein